jgi:hypothetical protein
MFSGGFTNATCTWSYFFSEYAAYGSRKIMFGARKTRTSSSSWNRTHNTICAESLLHTLLSVDIYLINSTIYLTTLRNGSCIRPNAFNTDESGTVLTRWGLHHFGIERHFINVFRNRWLPMVCKRHLTVSIGRPNVQASHHLTVLYGALSNFFFNLHSGGWDQGPLDTAAT